jgi:MoaA/NifB/PqqE/SkfB family radical SAM enzyme
MYTLFKTIDEMIRSAKVVWQLFCVRWTGKARPVFMYLHLTNRCNLNCSYCYANVDNRFHDSSVKDLSTEQWVKLIDDSSRMGARYFHLYGGEPLVRNDIDQLIDHCLARGALVEIMTNGHYVPKKIEKLKRVHSICLSIDGSEEENDKVRGKGNYAAVKEAVRICKENRLHVRMHATINAFNLSDPEYLPKLAREWGTTISYSMPHIPERTEMSVVDHATVTVQDVEILAFLKKIKQMKLDGYPIDNTLESLEYTMDYPLPLGQTLWSETEMEQVERKFGKKLLNCVFGKLAVIVDSEGYVIKCINHGMRDGLKFQEVGFKNAYEYARDTKSKPYNCMACAYLQFTELNNAVTLSSESIKKGIKYHVKWRGMTKRNS